MGRGHSTQYLINFPILHFFPHDSTYGVGVEDGVKVGVGGTGVSVGVADGGTGVEVSVGEGVSVGVAV